MHAISRLCLTVLGLAVSAASHSAAVLPDAVNNVPEPGSLALAALGLAGAVLAGRAGRRRAARLRQQADDRA